MKMIDADALIGALHNHAFLEGDDRSICYNIIQKQPTIKTETRWVPCSERLPHAEYGESDIVLVTCESTLIRLLFFDGGNWCYPTGERYEHRIDKVVAWMPLPTAYKEGADECSSK
jgi:hypothetical protein